VKENRVHEPRSTRSPLSINDCSTCYDRFRVVRRILLSAIVCFWGCVPDGPAPDAKPTKPTKSAAKRAAPKVRPASARPTGQSPARPTKPEDDPFLEAPFADDFEREKLGDAWFATSKAWTIDEGRLCAKRARNHPVWLRRRLPTNARIEFDAESASADGDLKAEFWGSGETFAKGVSYDHATSYLTIFGGWKNQFHVLARLDEHAETRKEIRLNPSSTDPREQKVEPNRPYRFVVERSDGKTVRWSVDGVELLSYPDEQPLAGKGHEHFGFNDWDVPVCFDNLEVTPLPEPT
jgi:hypothetical protein